MPLILTALIDIFKPDWILQILMELRWSERVYKKYLRLIKFEAFILISVFCIYIFTNWLG